MILRFASPGRHVDGTKHASRVCRDLDKFLPPRRRAKAYVDTRPEMQFEHFPIEDLSVPSFEGLERTVDKVIEKLNAGEKVYLHCWGGRGRAGMVGACVLAKVYGLR